MLILNHCICDALLCIVMFNLTHVTSYSILYISIDVSLKEFLLSHYLLMIQAENDGVSQIVLKESER